MTITVVFGIPDGTDAAIDGQEGADLCAIIGAAEISNADLPILESMDMASVFVNEILTVNSAVIACAETGDTCSIGVQIFPNIGPTTNSRQDAAHKRTHYNVTYGQKDYYVVEPPNR